MASYNKVILVGNLTRDVQLRFTASGVPVADFGLAVNERVKTATGDYHDEPVFVDITCWQRTAEVASEYLAKGSPVLIDGRLKLDTWDQEGQKRSKLKVTCERLQMLATKGERQPAASGGGNSIPNSSHVGGAEENLVSVSDSDLPF